MPFKIGTDSGTDTQTDGADTEISPDKSSLTRYSFICDSKGSNQYKTLYAILNNIEVYDEPVPRSGKIPHRSAKFQASEENRIEYESLY